MIITRRNFFKALGGVAVAVAAAELIIPSTRTIFLPPWSPRPTKYNNSVDVQFGSMRGFEPTDYQREAVEWIKIHSNGVAYFIPMFK